jgi:hypothetical protein
MAPNQPTEVASIPESTESHASTHEPRPRAHLSRPAGKKFRGGSESSLIQMFGWAGLLAGAAVTIGPRYVAPLGEIAGAVESMGLSGSLLGLCGLLMIAVGRVRRGQVDLARRTDEATDMELFYEQLSNEFLSLRGAMDEVQRDNGTTRGALGKVNAEIATVQQMLADAAAQPDGAQDALFRLAASLDKMSARVEQRMNSQFESFQTGLTAVRDDIVQAQSNLAVVLADLPKMVAAQAELKKTMGELPKLAANLDGMRRDLPAAIRGYVAESVDQARARLQSDFDARLDESMSAARDTLDQTLRHEFEVTHSKLSQEVSGGMQAAAGDLRTQIEHEVESALAAARSTLAQKLGVDLQSEFHSARKSLSSSLHQELEKSFKGAREDLAKNLQRDLEGRTQDVRGDLTSLIEQRLEQDLARASANLAATLGRELGDNLQRSHSEFSDSLILRLQQDFERARDDMDSTLTQNVHGDFEELRSDLVGQIEQRLTGSARQTRDELGGRLESNLRESLARARSELAEQITQRCQGDLQTARADLAELVRTRLDGDLGSTREELAGTLQSRLSADFESLRADLSRMIGERVQSDLSAAREDLGAFLRGEVQQAMSALPEMIKTQVETNVESLLGPSGQNAEPAKSELDNPVVAEKVIHALDESYDAAYRDTAPALPAPVGSLPGISQPRRLESWNAEQTRFYNPKTPAERAAELEAKDKLQQINSLLKDEHLREALEDLDETK